MSNLKICTRCVMDETVPDIFFDKNGVCNLCTAAIKKINDEVFTGDIGRQKLENLAEEATDTTNRNVIIKKVKLNSTILKEFRIMKLIHEIKGPGSKGKKQKIIPITDIVIVVNIIKVFNFFIKF